MRRNAVPRVDTPNTPRKFGGNKKTPWGGAEKRGRKGRRRTRVLWSGHLRKGIEAWGNVDRAQKTGSDGFRPHTYRGT